MRRRPRARLRARRQLAPADGYPGPDRPPVGYTGTCWAAGCLRGSFESIGVPVRHRRTAPRVVADRDIARRVAAELNGRGPLAGEFLARVVARAAHPLGSFCADLAVQVGGQVPQSGVARRPDNGGWQESSGARRRVAGGRILKSACRLRRRAARRRRQQRGHQGGEDHQRLLDRLAVDHADAAEVGQVRGQHRERRADTENVSLAAAAAPGTVCKRDRSCGSALAISVVNRARPSASRPDVVAAADLRIQERSSLVDQLSVCGQLALASSTSSRADWISRASSGPEPLNASNVSRSRSCSRVLPRLLTSSCRPREQLGDVLADRGAVLADRCAVSQQSRATVLSGGTRSTYCSPTADTLLTVAVTFSGILCRC